MASPFLGRAVVWVDVTPPSLEVLADRDQLLQALVNLVGNAADRMRRTGRVVVRAEPAGDGLPWSECEGVTVAVFDEGLPIPSDLLDDLLAPSPSSGAQRVGYSLGLAIAQGIAQGHGGSVSLESPAREKIQSAVLTGAAFKLRVPVRAVRLMNVPPAED